MTATTSHTPAIAHTTPTYAARPVASFRFSRDVRTVLGEAAVVGLVGAVVVAWVVSVGVARRAALVPPAEAGRV